MQQQNQMGAQNQANVMPEPPTMVSTKDQLYITDMLSWNLIAAKKAHFFAGFCQNQELKAALEQAGQMHQRHYEKILQHLNENPNPKQPNQPLN
ncbi:hypothetical protein GLW08_18965 [Pontibacillus yanchengensis]|uniref:Uncharacterized protein n=2 Tax=Pontibacillus yanchengensis TaxID=462910 RepID=A0ACC7VKU8_9BACI|nr:hypothetical protein [Pontibacillus yanchengensis]MYL33704.1 hypothetical protein [Pontibacillus yanchengensis]MYL55398.1 hypothetical protein [Pontibacillus yanchengensis]